MSDIAVHSESTEGMSSFIEDKTLLMRQEDKKGNNLYFHFKECLKYLFAHQKSDAFISFEHISQKMKSVKIYSNYEEPPTDNPALLSTARIQQKLFTKAEGEEEEPVIEENTEHPFPNVMESAYQLELAGIGLSACETMNLALAIKQLVSSIPVKTARFWGKVFGTLQNMYVVEVEFEEGEDMDEDEEDSEGQNDADEEEVANEVDDDDAETARDVLPKNKWKPPIKAPKEPNNQIGVNQKAYFVCHEPGLKWIRLPPVTPQQIVAARSICTLFTGNLDNTVNCSPAFPGTEAHYLRAQIARISSSTHISPEGYFQLGQGGEEEEEQMEDEEGNPSQMCSKNPDYESIPAEQLVTGGLEQWVHHIPYILPQGRVTWWNPSRTSGEEMEDVMEDEDEDEGGDQSKPPPPRPERGPPILSKIASDLAIFGQPAWSVRLSSQLIPEHASVVVSSNLWPGAHAVAWGKSFENVYIGWGLKASGPGFQSHLPVDPLDEFQDTPEISETLDPTPEDEAALRAAHNMENVEEEHGEDNGSDADRADEEQEED
ncbi:unnamed protein product [Echinostoma caproni]|uniref:Radial spoke head protein 4 A n=1 Tax=Echinostoma caproni TaxID=27848 RepID=A0A183AFJ6_9TREM|nr:unnamed protein product [Echinostoma caproni]